MNLDFKLTYNVLWKCIQGDQIFLQFFDSLNAKRDQGNVGAHHWKEEKKLKFFWVVYRCCTSKDRDSQNFEALKFVSSKNAKSAKDQKCI